MVYLSKKDTKKIQHDLKEIIKSKLLNNFTNRKIQPVVEVEKIIVEYTIDESKSDRDNIFLSPIYAFAHVWVSLQGNVGKTNNQLKLRINTAHFLYNTASKEYEIINSNQIELIDIS